MSYKIAIAGASGNVGREMLNILAERDFPCAQIDALASSRSIGKQVSFGNKILSCQELEHYDFSTTDIALFACGSGPTKIHAPRAAKAGCVVIDNSSLYRMEKNVPLIVPEVNGDELKNYKKRNIIANPNCSTAQLMVALKPLHDLAPIKRVVVSTYQSVSGAGAAAMDELFNQTKALLVNDAITKEVFPKQIAFNVIPQIGEFVKDGITQEERKMKDEIKKILDKNIKMSVTCVRVPVFVGHSEAVSVEFSAPIELKAARTALEEAAGLIVLDRRDDGGYITPLECVGDYNSYVSRIRLDETVDSGINMWVVSDNLRKGAALNAVQIAEELIRDYLTTPRG